MFYDIVAEHVDRKTGASLGRGQTKMNAEPMTHADACIVLSKMPQRNTAAYCIRYMLVEVAAPAEVQVSAAPWMTRARLRFTCPIEAARRITEKTDLRERLNFCASSVSICDAPGYRFCLEASDIPANVRAVYADALAACFDELAPVGAKLAAAFDALGPCGTISEAWTRSGVWQGSDEARGFGVVAGDERVMVAAAVSRGLCQRPASNALGWR